MIFNGGALKVHRCDVVENNEKALSLPTGGGGGFLAALETELRDLEDIPGARTDIARDTQEIIEVSVP